ncbi:MAG: HU family DNA-binding protein [Bacteroidales bacterium]|nr:HU family DNA-binding protein [Bacteroidales bacterium]
MNKNDLVKAMAAKAGMTNVDARKALEAFVAVTEESLKKGEKISLIGFGTFDIATRKARTGVNPMTHAKIKIPAKKVVKFKPGANMAL